jgi:hypothetical protein
MNYSELVQMYFERSVALQWFWTIYVLVIGGVVGFSTFRQRPELTTTVLVALLYGCFAYKNLGAIEATAVERQAILSAIRQHPESSELERSTLHRIRPVLEPTMPDYDVPAARQFHLICDLLTIVFITTKEWRRRKSEQLVEAKAK